MEEDTSPKFTPALTTSSHDTVTALADDPFLHTPTKTDTSNTSALSSFLFPSRSFDIQQYENIKDIVPGWNDDEVDEIMILSPKSKLKASLSVIDESQEILASLPTVASFKLEHSIASSVDCPRVCIARHTETCRLYVIKTYAKSIISYDTPTLEQAMKEQMMLRLLTTMDAQFIIKLLWSFQDEEAMHLVMDFCPNRDLKTYIERHGPLSKSAALICAAELVEALCNLHASDITHRRVRPEHILLNASGHIVLAGFSNASFSSPNTPPSSTSQQPGSCSPVNQWDAPEVVLGWTQDCAIDVWSFGLVLWYMLMGTHLLISGPSHENRHATLHPSILSSLILHAPIRLDGHDKGEVCDLVAWCVHRNARFRPTTSDVKGHPYFANIDWNRLRKKQYKVDLHPPGPPLEDISVSRGSLKDLPGSETLRGVHIAGFDFVHQESSQDQLDFSEGDFFSQGKSLEVSGDADHSAVASDDFEFSSVLDKRATFASAVDSVYVTPAGSVGSEVKSAASGDVQSTALFSCTSFGELRDSLDPGEASASGPPKLGVTENQQDDSQSPKSTHSVPARRASDSICPVLTTDSMTTLTGRDSAPIVAPTSILRRDTDNDILSRSASRTSVLGLGNTSRPPSAMSLGGARGLRLRKYASLNFDLDTVTSLDNDDSFTRPQSFNTSRRVSFVDSLKDCSSSKAIDANAPNSKAEESVAKLATASLSAPIGMGHPWSLKNLNNFRVASPSWHVTPNLTSTPATSTGSGPANMHNKLKKKQRTTSTPVLSATPRLQDKTVDLPEGLKQIGLGIGYTHTPSRMISPRFPGFSPGEGSHGLQSPTSTPGRRAVSIIGTTSAIQRCTSIFSGLRHGKQGMGGSEKRGQGRLDALVERASEESDALEAVMREMYGTSWTAEGGSPSYGGGGPENVRKPGKVYSVPGMPGMTETLTRSRADATSSTLRLVEQTREAEL